MGEMDASPAQTAAAHPKSLHSQLRYKRIDQGRFVWPVMPGYDGSITLTPAQLAMLIEGIDWRAPERVWKPVLAG